VIISGIGVAMHHQSLDQMLPVTDDILDLVESFQGDFPDIAFEDPFELFPPSTVKMMMQ
jgi:hypothetical protein